MKFSVYSGRTLALIAAAAFFVIAVPVSVISMPESVRIPIVKEHGTGDPPDAALFSHWTHQQYHCYECHPSIFPKRKLGFTHADMNQGKFCGACHDGNRSWHHENDASISCETCHVEREPSELDDLDIDDLFGSLGHIRFAGSRAQDFRHIPLATEDVRDRRKE